MNESETEFEGQAIVCFIDILGFSNDIRNNWDKPKADTKHPLNKIRAIKAKAKNFENMRVEANKNFSRHIITTSISDSFVIRASVDHSSELNEIDEGLRLTNAMKAMQLVSVIYEILNIWLACIMSGYTIRGGIDIGNVYWNNKSVIGPAFINAYELESKIAKNSRIVISSNLNKVIKTIFDGPIDDEACTLRELLGTMLRRDVDGYIIVNPKTMNPLGDNEWISQRLLEMKKHIKHEIIREKYTPLIYMLENINSEPLTVKDFGHY